jgi:hypothetical protein
MSLPPEKSSSRPQAAVGPFIIYSRGTSGNVRAPVNQHHSF